MQEILIFGHFSEKEPYEPFLPKSTEIQNRALHKAEFCLG